MGITKFRTFEEAEQALWNVMPDAKYFDRVRAMFDVAGRLCSSTLKPGITKFRSIEDKERAVPPIKP